MQTKDWTEYDNLLEETKEQQDREDIHPDVPKLEEAEQGDTKPTEDKTKTEEPEKKVNYGPDDEKFKNQLNEDGTPKSTHEVIDPKKFGIKENLQEAGNAIGGGVVDLYNSIGSLPKYTDPEFWQKDNPDDPYKFNAPWLIENKPVTRTAWGGFIRVGTEMTVGTVATGGVLSALRVPGLINKAVGASKVAQRSMKIFGASKISKIAVGKTGKLTANLVGYDFISNQTQDQNLTRALVDMNPKWLGVLSPLATNAEMSPAQRSLYNIGETLAIAPLIGKAFVGAGWANRKVIKPLTKQVGENLTDPLSKAVHAAQDLDYKIKGKQAEIAAAKKLENKEFKKFIRQPGNEKVKIKEWRKTHHPFKDLSKADKEILMEEAAQANDIEWGANKRVDKVAQAQMKANAELAEQQLEFDIAHKQGGPNRAYNIGGDVTDNQAIATGDGIRQSVIENIEIRNNPLQAHGTPGGVITEANIRRLEHQAPGTVLREVNALAKQLDADPVIKEMYRGAGREAIAEDLKNAGVDLIDFLNDSGHSRLIDIPQEDVLKYIKAKGAGRETVIEGIGALNTSQLAATDVVLGQLLYEARDVAKAALSVADKIDAAQPGGLLEPLLARYSAVARLRKETSMLSSFNLKRFNSGGKLKETPDLMAMQGKASDAAANEVAVLKQVLQNDPSDDLLETFLHFTATSNGKKQTWKDFQSFFKRQLHGYRDGDVYQRNSIIEQMQLMGMNSMLSGPKTPMRALAGTGLGTVMRPVATIIGSSGDYLKGNDAITRGAFANLGGMVSSVGDSWRKAVADFQSYNMHPEGFRGFTPTKSDQHWNSLKEWAETYGSDADKAVMRTTDWLRGVNHIPIFNYGPRIMKAQDAFFTNMIGRGRQKQLAFNEVYDKLKSQNLTVSDEDFAELIQTAEKQFESKVFTADGMVADEMVKFAADEAKLTKELTGRVKSLERVFDRTPYLKPFFLFARTGVNALEMTSKYTPGLNMFIKEHKDIMTKAWNDPDMIRYGIKSQGDLEIAKSTMKGRMAVGNGVAFSAAYMALNGKITGNGPPDRSLRDSWIQAGWQPRSIKIGDSWVSYESLEPFNMILSFAADTVDGQKVMGDQWAGDWYGRLAYLISANVTNRTFLAGLLELQDLIYSKGGDAPRVLANFTNNQVPLSGFRNEMGKLFSPGMRELESGYWQSIGNRNLWADLMPGQNGMLPYKYDILDGSKIKSYDPMTRLYNSISPFQVNMGTNATRELLMRSGLNLKQTFNSGPDGISLRKLPDMRSKFQFLMSQQNVEKKLTELFKNPQIVQSIYDMEADRASGQMYQPKDTLHGPFIRQIFTNAKKRAWQQLLQEGDMTAKQLQELHRYEEIEARHRKQGQGKRAVRMRKEIDNLKTMIYK